MKKDYIQYLNEIGIPEDDKKSNGGRISDHAKYGNWIYRNDPIAFEVGYQEWNLKQYNAKLSNKLLQKNPG